MSQDNELLLAKRIADLERRLTRFQSIEFAVGFPVLRPPTYTVATRPTASAYAGGIIYVSDAATGSKFQGSDGTSWVSLG